MKEIPLYKFMRRKYRKELLADVDDLSFMRPWLKQTPVHRDNFYRIILITGGNGKVSLGDSTTNLSSGDVICSMPGEIWHWIDGEHPLEGFAMLYEEQFLTSFFSDSHFVGRQSYLTADGRTPFFHTEGEAYANLLSLFSMARKEVDRKEDADAHFLRAMLYGIMTLVGRTASKSDISTQRNSESERYVDRFIRLVKENFAAEHSTEFYADRLCVTPNYLNTIVRRALGTSAKAFIMQHLTDEAKKLLAYTSLTTQEIAGTLNFSTPTYFCRFFARQTLMSPQQFRENLRSHEK